MASQINIVGQNSFYSIGTISIDTKHNDFVKLRKESVNGKDIKFAEIRRLDLIQNGIFSLGRNIQNFGIITEDDYIVSSCNPSFGSYAKNVYKDKQLISNNSYNIPQNGISIAPNITRTNINNSKKLMKSIYIFDNSISENELQIALYKKMLSDKHLLVKNHTRKVLINSISRKHLTQDQAEQSLNNVLNQVTPKYIKSIEEDAEEMIRYHKYNKCRKKIIETLIFCKENNLKEHIFELNEIYCQIIFKELDYKIKLLEKENNLNKSITKTQDIINLCKGVKMNLTKEDFELCKDYVKDAIVIVTDLGVKKSKLNNYENINIVEEIYDKFDENKSLSEIGLKEDRLAYISNEIEKNDFSYLEYLKEKYNKRNTDNTLKEISDSAEYMLDNKYYSISENIDKKKLKDIVKESKKRLETNKYKKLLNNKTQLLKKEISLNNSITITNDIINLCKEAKKNLTKEYFEGFNDYARNAIKIVTNLGIKKSKLNNYENINIVEEIYDKFDENKSLSEIGLKEESLKYISNEIKKNDFSYLEYLREKYNKKNNDNDLKEIDDSIKYMLDNDYYSINETKDKNWLNNLLEKTNKFKNKRVIEKENQKCIDIYNNAIEKVIKYSNQQKYLMAEFILKEQDEIIKANKTITNKQKQNFLTDISNNLKRTENNHLIYLEGKIIDLKNQLSKNKTKNLQVYEKMNSVNEKIKTKINEISNSKKYILTNQEKNEFSNKVEKIKELDKEIRFRKNIIKLEKQNEKNQERTIESQILSQTKTISNEQSKEQKLEITREEPLMER